MAKFNTITAATKHTSLGIMAVGSVGIFTANLLFKEVFNATDYGIYSLVITCLSLLNSFGLLGLEQVVLRTGHLEVKNRLEVNRFLIISTVVVLIVGSVSFGLLMGTNLISELSASSAILMSLGITLTMLLYNLFRLNSDFVIAQSILNAWKIGLGALALLTLFAFRLELIDLLNAIAYFLCGSAVLTLLYLLYRFKFVLVDDPSRSHILRFTFQFFIALLGISLISYADKFFIEYRFGLEDLGYYFYLANLFIFPFSLIQNYIGFKVLVAFKERFSIALLKTKIRRTSFFGLAMVLALLAGVYIAAELSLIDVDLMESKELIVLMLLVGFIKLNYALLSATVGARADIAVIRSINIGVLAGSAVVALIGYFWISSLVQVALVVLLFWAIRFGAYGFNILKKIPNHEA